jgi:transposase InsO family protein
LIKGIFLQRAKGYGYITMQLKRKYGLMINPKTTYRYMRILGLKSPVRKRRYRYTTPSEAQQKSRIVSPNILNRDFSADKPLKKLVTDVSYIYHKGGRLYLSVIKDLYDNSILAYKISKFNDYQFVYDNVKMIIDEFGETLKGTILHSDQDWQYTLKQFNTLLETYKIISSHSRKGNCLDNSPCENFFFSFKIRRYST